MLTVVTAILWKDLGVSWTHTWIYPALVWTKRPLKSKGRFDRWYWLLFIADIKTNVASEVMKDIIPSKSAKTYDRVWAAFMDFNKDGSLDEEDFLKYFHHLKHEKNYKASSLHVIR